MKFIVLWGIMIFFVNLKHYEEYRIVCFCVNFFSWLLKKGGRSI